MPENTDAGKRISSRDFNGRGRALRGGGAGELKSAGEDGADSFDAPGKLYGVCGFGNGQLALLGGVESVEAGDTLQYFEDEGSGFEAGVDRFVVNDGFPPRLFGDGEGFGSGEGDPALQQFVADLPLEGAALFGRCGGRGLASSPGGGFGFGRSGNVGRNESIVCHNRRLSGPESRRKRGGRRRHGEFRGHLGIVLPGGVD